MINKFGSPAKMQVLKQGAFDVDVNILTSVIADKYLSKSLSINQLHEVLKALGVVDYSSEDMSSLVGRLHAVGIAVTENA